MQQKKLIAVAVIGLFMNAGAYAFEQNQTCPPGVTNCTTGDQQVLGDVHSTTNNGDSKSNASQLGNSTASNQSGNDITTDINTKNANTNNMGSDHAQATGGAATGGSATGNRLDSNNQIGDTSSNSGGNMLGNTSTNNTGGNTLGNANEVITGGNTTTSKGGNASAHGGNSTSGAASNSGGNIMGQGQEMNGSGNSDNRNNTSSGVAGSGNSKTDVDNKLSNSQGQGQSNDNSGNSKNDINNKNANAQGQAMGQGQGQSSSNSNSTSSGATSSQSQGITGSGNSDNKNSQGQSSENRNKTGDNEIRVDASDRSSNHYEDNTKYIFIPSVIPATPPSVIGVGNIVKETTACGPLQKVVKTPVIGKFFGVMMSDDVEQGFTYDLEAWYDESGQLVNYFEIPLPDGTGVRLIGHQAVIMATVVGTANARNIAIGGGGSNGNWGQGGTGTSAANQQLVTNIQLRHCEIGTMLYPKPAPVVEAVTRKIRE